MIDLNKYLFSAFAIISLSVPLAIAQDSDDDVEEVIVTGSRIIVLTLLALPKSQSSMGKI